EAPRRLATGGVAACPTEDGSVAGQRDGGALWAVPSRAGADQLVFLLGPNPAAAGEYPRRADARAGTAARVVARPAHEGGVAVGGQRDGGALGGVPSRASADQLVSLLGPDAAAAGEDARR